MALAGYFSYLGGVPQVWPLGGCGLWAMSPLLGWVSPEAFGRAGGARGLVAARAGFWDVLATWVWGWQLRPLGSWASNLHVRLRG